VSESNLPELPTHQPSKSDKAREIELLGRFIGVQEQEIKQRASEAQIRLKELDCNTETAKQSIGAQLEVEKLRVGAFEKRDKNRFWLILVVIIAIVIIFALCLAYNAKDMLLDIVKVLVGAFGGGGVGYVMGKKEQPSSSSQTNDSDE
jgi:Trk-type K+ transport system membrane component